MKKKIGIIIGSLRKDSFNRMVAHTIMNVNKDVTFREIGIKDLPLFNEDLEVGGDPESVCTFKRDIESVEGIIIVSPEYNSGIPGVLKNALDWASRPAKSSVLADKYIGVIGATPGGMGTVYAQMQIRQTLEAIKAHVLPFKKVLISQVHEKIHPDNKVIVDEKTKEYMISYVQALCEWIDT